MFGVLWIILSALILAADQLVKYYIHANAALGESLYSIPHLFDIVYVRNEGAAFSILSGKVPLLSIISVAFCIAIIVYCIVKKPQNRLFQASLSLLWAGAAGNAIDRLIRGYVIDYISVNFISFPVFNIADIAICVGAALMVLCVIIFDKD